MVPMMAAGHSHSIQSVVSCFSGAIVVMATFAVAFTSVEYFFSNFTGTFQVSLTVLIMAFDF